MDILLVGLGGIFGAILRQLVDSVIPEIINLPIGTLTVNLAGCFFLGFLYSIKKLQANSPIGLLIGVGFLGSFTTFSTFSVEVLSLIQTKQLFLSTAYILITVIGGLIFAILGFNLSPAFKRKKRL